MADLPMPELVENRRRSVAMLPPGVPALNGKRPWSYWSSWRTR